MRGLNLSQEDFDALETVENELLALDKEPSHSELLSKIYSLPDEAINELTEKYKPLKIAGPVDKQGRLVVHTALMEVKSVITSIEKTRLKTNEKAQAWIKVNNGEAKRLTGLLEPIRSHLQTERDNHDNQVEAIKIEVQRKLDERNQKRMTELLAVGATISLPVVVNMDDNAYADYLKLVTNDYNNRMEFEKKKAEEDRLKAEKEAEEKALQEAEKKKKLEEEKAKIEADRLENERIANELKIEREKINKEKAEAEIERRMKEQAEISRLESIEKERKEKEKAALIESLKPDSEKLKVFSEYLNSIDLPEMATEQGKQKALSILQAKRGLVDFIIVRANELLK